MDPLHHHDGSLAYVRVGKIARPFAERLHARHLFVFQRQHLSPEYKYFSPDTKDPEGYWADTYTNSLALSYNTTLVPKEKVPQRSEDLCLLETDVPKTVRFIPEDLSIYDRINEVRADTEKLLFR